MVESRKPESNPAVENVRAIVELERQTLEEECWGDRISSFIGRVIGTLRFVAFHVAGFAAWAAWNSLAPVRWHFDPYPWGLLTFIMSMEGVLIATFVLIAQNRMSRQSDHRDHLDLQVDLLAEQEMTVMLRMLRRISDHLGIPPERSEVERADQLTQQTNIHDLMETIRRELPDEPRR
jgi:uncharacterized membrane protein